MDPVGAMMNKHLYYFRKRSSPLCNVLVEIEGYGARKTDMALVRRTVGDLVPKDPPSLIIIVHEL